MTSNPSFKSDGKPDSLEGWLEKKGHGKVTKTKTTIMIIITRCTWAEIGKRDIYALTREPVH